MPGGRKSWYEIICDKHGKPEFNRRMGTRKVVRVTPRLNKQNMGCPLCKKEQSNEMLRVQKKS